MISFRKTQSISTALVMHLSFNVHKRFLLSHLLQHKYPTWICSKAKFLEKKTQKQIYHDVKNASHI